MFHFRKLNMHVDVVCRPLLTHLSFPSHGSHPFEVQLIDEQLFSLRTKCSTNTQRRGYILYSAVCSSFNFSNAIVYYLLGIV